MEQIHGVDVSWLHHSPKGQSAIHLASLAILLHPGESDSTQTACLILDILNTDTAVCDIDHGAQKTPVTVEEVNGASAHKTTSDPTPKSNGSPPKPNGTSHHQSPLHHQLHRHSISHHPQEKQEAPSRSQSTSVHKNEKPSALTRKTSWVSSISSKFSSTSNSSAPNKSVEPSSPARAKTPPVEYSNPFNTSSPVAAKESKRSPADQSSSTPPASPGKSGDGFLKSAMRRLSSSGGATGAKAASHGATCPRKTMNIDPYRERCSMPELDQRKLRRVAFLVDVEIAGAAQYPNADEIPKSPPPPVSKESSLTKMERQFEDQKKRKDQQLKKSEGEALKHPNDLADEKANAGVVKATGEPVTPENPGIKPEIKSESPKEQRVKEPTRKREKKRRSESERKERKERKQREALANGKIPAEIYRDGLSSSNTSSGSSTPSGTSTPPKHQDRPTTDPLRIYRRCCQLRETPILKRIAEQVASPSACPAATPGVISCLDLTGYWLQLPDVITLGDYLAIVPVKRLIMENCGLGDEAVRVILAGLMAAKTPEQAKYNRKLGKKHQHHSKHRDAVEKLCVVEKLSFKNNPKIGREGWRHIALFVNMSRSLKAIDLSMIPFPKPQARSESASPPHQQGHVAATFPPPGQEDLTLILQEAISTRLGRDHLEELVMGECGLTTDSVCRIVQAVASCSVKRLGLASNQLTRASFQQIFNYVKTGLCEGLDIGGNDLRDWIDDFAQCLDNRTPLYALSVAACNLLPSSLDKLFPALLRLPNFRFIDLSHNRDLFATRPSAIHAIRKYLPQFPLLKRIHLLDTMMNPEHAVSLAEVLPECKVLAHLNILDNEPIKPLADAKTESAQEEACAMYASFMAAVRVSDSIVRVDIDVPSAESSDIVKAMAKQVVAYSLRNLERLPLAETTESTIAAMTPVRDTDTDTETYPNVLRSLIGNVEGFKDEGKPEPAPDEDYIVGGTGVAKALDICLKRAMDTQKTAPAAQCSPARSGATTPVLKDTEMVKGGKAKEMSKILLNGARQIKSRLQPALAKEARADDNMNYRTSCLPPILLFQFMYTRVNRSLTYTSY